MPSIDSFNKCVLSSYYGPGTQLGTQTESLERNGQACGASLVAETHAKEECWARRGVRARSAGPGAHGHALHCCPRPGLLPSEEGTAGGRYGELHPLGGEEAETQGGQHFPDKEGKQDREHCGVMWFLDTGGKVRTEGKGPLAEAEAEVQDSGPEPRARPWGLEGGPLPG